MSDTPADDQKPADETTSNENQAADAAAELPPVDEWKPEPRSWSWKDIFTAPMLAFKPKCMLISLLTVVAIWLVGWGYGFVAEHVESVVVLNSVAGWIVTMVQAAIFGVGATFVATFMKADLLDDEFLSLKEGLQQFSKRLLPAILVPVFLVAVAYGMHIAIYLGMLLCSIPLVGGVLYALLQILAIPLGIFAVLLCIGVILGFFVFPAIVAIRKHSWFDNVIDTFEAVGTKPHILVASIALTVVMAAVSYNIGMGSLMALKYGSQARNVPGSEVAKVEGVTNHWLQKFTPVDEVAGRTAIFLNPAMLGPGMGEPNGFQKYGTGLVTGIIQSLFALFVTGYAINILLAGGMLTYLNVREDDYWDDEDLEDLDALAKELEEEAKQAAAAAEASADKPAEAPASDEKPADDKPAEEASDDKPAEEAENDALANRKVDPNLVETMEMSDDAEAPAEEAPAEEAPAEEAKADDEQTEDEKKD